MASNTWAVLVSTSAFWFNYRHASNALSIHQILRRLGAPPERVLLLLADDVACNPRTLLPGTVFNHPDHEQNVYTGAGCGLPLPGEGEDALSAVRTVLRGAEVTVANFLALLTDRLPADAPPGARLASDASSRLVLYMTGHGGDNFFKFRDREELTAAQLGDALSQMRAQGRFREALLLFDTCQASTMFDDVKVPGVLALASSLRGESSYSHHIDSLLGAPILDRFTTAMLMATKRLVRPPVHVADADKRLLLGGGPPAMPHDNAMTVQELYDQMDPRLLSSHAYITHTALENSGTPRTRLLADYLLYVHVVHPIELAPDTSADGGGRIVRWVRPDAPDCAWTAWPRVSLRSPPETDTTVVFGTTLAGADTGPAFTSYDMAFLAVFLVAVVFFFVRQSATSVY